MTLVTLVTAGLLSAGPVISSHQPWVHPSLTACTDEACAGKPAPAERYPEGSGPRVVKTPDGHPVSVCTFADGHVEVLPQSWFCVVDAKPMRLQVFASEAPPTRTRLSFDSTTGDHLEVEWQPAESARLSKAVTLGPGGWQVSLWAEPARDAFNPLVDFAWHALPPRKTGPYKLTLDVDALQGAVSPDGGVVASSRRATVSIWQASTLTLTEAAKSVGAREGGVLGGPAATGRAFGALPEKEAVELINLVAQIVVERAKAKGFTLLTDQVRHVLCDDLVLQGQPAHSLFGDEGRRVVLPHTCELVRGLRLQDVAATGVPLLHAFVQDLIELATEVALANVSRSELSEATRTLLVEGLSQAGSMATRSLAGGHNVQLDPQLLLSGLARREWLKGVPFDPGGVPSGERNVACAAQLAFAVVAACHANACDARAVRDSLDHADRYFELEGCSVKHALDSWPGIERFVASALTLLSPPPNMTPVQQAHAAVELLFDLVERFELALKASSAPLRRLQETAKARNLQGAIDLSSGSVGLLASLRGVFLGAVDGDIQPALAGVTGVVLAATGEDDPARKAMQKAAAIGGAVTSYLQASTAAQAAGQNAEAVRAARKQAVESLIDSSTERSGREREWVFSLSGSLRVLGGATGATSFASSFYRWSLPLGLSLAYLGRNGGGGMYFELSPLDLGRYVNIKAGTVEAPSPWDCFGAYGAVGWQFGGNLPVIAGVEAAFLPGITTHTDPGQALPGGSTTTRTNPSWEVGAFLGIEVPLFDIN